jgi:uncharacterized membrane protein SirB2
MKWAALITWIVTALGGFGLLGIWLSRGGLAQSTMPGTRIRPPLIFSHLLLAAGGLVLWIIYVASDTEALAWIAAALLAVVAALGFTMFAIWLQRRQRQMATASAVGSHAQSGDLPAEQHFPIPVVGLHGLLAASTLVLAFLTAGGVGS